MSSVTGLGDFSKFLGKIFLSKIAQILVDFLGCFEKHPILSTHFYGYFFV